EISPREQVLMSRKKETRWSSRLPRIPFRKKSNQVVMRPGEDIRRQRKQQRLAGIRERIFTFFRSKFRLFGLILLLVVLIVGGAIGVGLLHDSEAYVLSDIEVIGT